MNPEKHNSRVANREFRAKPLMVHSFLHDVPLHDAWVMRLRGGGEGRTLEDVQALLWSMRAETVGPVAALLFNIRMAVGRRLGWDEERPKSPELSYVYRLTEEDRARSIDEPGSISGIMGVPSGIVYAFENEELHEIINFTGHHFLLMSMEPADEGYNLYWAIYTRSTGWFTPLYMALIDPFRRMLLYPRIIRKLERCWSVTYGTEQTAEEELGAQAPNSRSVT